MTQEVQNVAAFSPTANGGIYRAPMGTPLPTDATTPLDAEFKGLGYVSVDGVVPAYDASSKTVIRAWGGDMVIEVTEEQGVARYDFTLIEVMSENVNEFVFGADNVTVTPASGASPTTVAIADKGMDPDDCVIVLDMLYKGKRARIVIEHASSAITGGNAFVHTAEAGWQLQVTCNPATDGTRQHIYFENDDAPGA